MNGEAAIILQGVHKAFGAVKAVEGLSLTIASGEIFGLVGPDGAGKSTTLRMIAALLPPDAGLIHVAGCDVVRHPESVRLHVGYLSQRFSLYEDLTVAENIAFFADMFGVPSRLRRQREEELLRITQLAPFTRRLTQHLSGGMKQKLALICTLIHRPQVLLLDEPTTGVDPVSRREFWRLLAALPAEGVTLLVCTPYLDEAERCHRVGFMARGRLLAVGTPEALKQHAPSHLYRLRVTPQRPARDFLRRHPGVLGAEVFGEDLHVALQEERMAAALPSLLREAGFQALPPARVAPTLEDAFVALAQDAQNNKS